MIVISLTFVQSSASTNDLSEGMLGPDFSVLKFLNFPPFKRDAHKKWFLCPVFSGAEPCFYKTSNVNATK